MNDFMKSVTEKYKGIETDINKRWEEGIEHHPESNVLVDELLNVDLVFGDDFFCFKIGGDGDNGEHLKYLLDIIFEHREADKYNSNWAKRRLD